MQADKPMGAHQAISIDLDTVESNDYFLFKFVLISFH